MLQIHQLNSDVSNNEFIKGATGHSRLYCNYFRQYIDILAVSKACVIISLRYKIIQLRW